MHRSSSILPHRQSRRAQRRKKLRRQKKRRRTLQRLALVAVVSLSTMWAFGAGYLWQQLRVRSTTTEAVAEQNMPQRRAHALEVLDRAVAARHGELTNEAVRLALDALRLDSDVPGASLFLGEMSLRRRDLAKADAAATEALDQQQYTSDAKLVLALSEWMRRGERDTAVAGAASIQLLAEAAEGELANNQVRFLAGDLLRAIGRPADAHASLVASLYRQQPWKSAALLTAKLWLALEEAGPKAQSGAALAASLEGEIYGANAAQLQRAIREQSETVQFASAMQSVFTAKQIAELSFDPALAAGVMAAARPAGEQLLLPSVRVNLLTEEVGSLPREAWHQETNALGGKHFQLLDELHERE